MEAAYSTLTSIDSFFLALVPYSAHMNISVSRPLRMWLSIGKMAVLSAAVLTTFLATPSVQAATTKAHTKLQSNSTSKKSRSSKKIRTAKAKKQSAHRSRSKRTAKHAQHSRS